MRVIKRIREFLEDWKYLIERNGLLTTLPEITSDLLHLPYRHLRFNILARSLDDSLPEYTPKIDLEIRPFDNFDLEQVKKINRPSEAQQCTNRLKLGHQGLVALHAGQLIGYAWGSSKVDSEVEQIPLDLKPCEVLCSDVYTDPAFRGRGVQTALSLARFCLFRDLGFLYAVCYIEVRNSPSLAVWQKKLGATITGSIDFLRVGPWYRIRCYNIY